MRIVTLVLAVHAPDEMSAANVAVLIDQMLDDGCTEMANTPADCEHSTTTDPVETEDCRKLFFGPSKVVSNLENQPQPIEPDCRPTHLSLLERMFLLES